MRTSLPPWPEDPLPELARRATERPVVVLDDDPTGTQTLRDITVLTAWDVDAIAGRLDQSVLFLSTNSRALEEADAAELTRDAARTVRDASEAARRPVSLVSRSDSTLRGHFPAETRAIGPPGTRVLLAPFFAEAGRLTIDDVHLLATDRGRVNVADTEFARDPTFGYRSRDLREWVAARFAAAGLPAPPIASLALELIRGSGPEGVARALSNLAPGAVAIANAEVDRDIEVVALGSVLAEEAGIPLVARTAASFVRARAGHAPAPPLAPQDLAIDGPGLIVVGSHVELTTGQLARLRTGLTEVRVTEVELAVEPLVAGGAAAQAAIANAAERLGRALAAGRIGLVATERIHRDVGLVGGRAIATALVGVVERIGVRPGWVIAKGGVTSHEIASRALGMREARVAGQLVPGASVWIGAADSRWPGLPLVIFPGNVGEETALLRVADMLGKP